MSCTSTFRKIAILVAMFVSITLGAVATARATSFTIVGNSNPNATAILNIISLSNTQLVFTVKNTSNSKVTGFGFDLVKGDFTSNSSSGLNGFSSANAGSFTFHDDALGNVPQFTGAVLDFGFTTGPSGNFSGDNPPTGLALNSTSPTFTVTGNFAGFTQQQIANAIFVRFQEIATNPDSDVGQVAAVPEPASMLLLGTGLLGLAGGLRHRRRSGK